MRWVAAKGQFYYSATGDPERMLGVTVDITERKNSEESLRLKEFELKEAQRLAGVGSWHWEPDTDTVVWSEELSRIAGRDPSLPGATYKEHEHLYTREGWERLKGMVEEALHSGAPYELDMQMIRTDGYSALGQSTRRGPSRCDRPHHRAPRHGPGHRGAQARRRSAVERESPCLRSPGVGAREDRKRSARRLRSASRIAGGGIGPTADAAPSGFFGTSPCPAGDASEADRGNHHGFAGAVARAAPAAAAAAGRCRSHARSVS